MQALDASLPLYNTRTLEEQRTSSLYTSRLAATLLTMFGLLALLLAAVGLYGVMAYTVNRRTREIGIRLALGAQGHEVRRLVMVEGATIVALGLVLGLGGALAATRLAGSFLYGVTQTDPIAYGSAALLLSAVTLLATVGPTRQVSRVDPLTAIRQ
jgi:ABC-type antimicrobial peptide transport system permease subunit